MFTIDKKKFGSFVAELRREKGLTQREVAERLFLSDKAVSKWETGASLPDTTLLIPLAELLGISVTELLLCERMTRDNALNADKVEDIVKAAIVYSDEGSERAYRVQSGWVALYGISLIIGCAGTVLNFMTKQPCLEMLMTAALLSAVFGAYFCCFVKMRLPAFYDENKVSVWYDGAFRMNLPGVSFNNKNWPHILKTARVCMCLSMIFFPLMNFALGSFLGRTWVMAGNSLFLAMFLCVLFLPIYLAGKKYQ